MADETVNEFLHNFKKKDVAQNNDTAHVCELDLLSRLYPDKEEEILKHCQGSLSKEDIGKDHICNFCYHYRTIVSNEDTTHITEII